MSTTTQYNPSAEHDATLLAAGASKTVYALVSPEVEGMKSEIMGAPDSMQRRDHLAMFREPWLKKQDSIHEDFFDCWWDWSKPLVDLDRRAFPFYYPTEGSSIALRHIIFDAATCRNATSGNKPVIHVFEGEYEGYKAYAEAAGLEVREHKRESWSLVPYTMRHDDLFFLSQPSAIDGNIWKDAEQFLVFMDNHGPDDSVILDLTYVGAVPDRGIKIVANHHCVRNVVISLSKPFGAYYDRIGGVFCHEEDPGLYGNKWFKNLTSLRLGFRLMERYPVFHMPNRYGPYQRASTVRIAKELEIPLLEPSDVYILANGQSEYDSPLKTYLRRPEKGGVIRVCLSPLMASKIAERA